MNAHGLRCTFLFQFISAILFLSIAHRGVGAERTWDGSSSTLWTTAANWSTGIAPVPGDSLVFPEVGFEPVFQSNFNNYANGTHFDRIRIFSSFIDAHQLHGNRITISNGVSASGSGTVEVDCDFTLAASQTFVSDQGGAFFPLTHLLGGTVALNAHNLTLEADGSTSIAGTISTTGHPVFSKLIKRGTGSLYVTPAGRILTSVDHVSGFMRVDGVVTNSVSTNGQVIVSGTNTPTLIGTGLVQNVRVGGTGIVSPGVGGPGILRIGTLYMWYRVIPEAPASAGRLILDINGLTPGTEHDQLKLEKGASLGVSGGFPPGTQGAVGTLDVRLGYAAQLNDSFVVMDISPGGSVGGSFVGTGLMGIVETTNGYSLGISPWGGDGNDLELEVVRRPDSPFALWKGATIMPSHFSLATNWAGGSVPGAGSRLLFGRYRNHFFPSITNDLSPGSAFATLEFIGTNYTLRGNPLTITEAITNTQNSDTTAIHCDLAVAGPLRIHNDGGLLHLAGRFAGSGTITKEGGGDLWLTGTTSNAFGGILVVNAGTLRVDGAQSDLNVVMNSGLLHGTGMVNSVTMNGGELSPGASPGSFRALGDLTLSSAATLTLELNNPIPVSGYDQLSVAGAISLNGASLKLSLGYSAVPGASFLIMVNEGTDVIQGTFAGLPEGAIFQVSNQWFRISYSAGTQQNDVVLTRVNPPGAFTGIASMIDGQVQLRGTGGSNLNYTIQANTNLNTTNWSSIGTANVSGGVFQFLDTNAPIHPMRFYRAVAP
jgi:autotransporter-associated beta strand protein